MVNQGQTGDGRNRLFNDSKLGVLVVGLATVAFDGVLDALISAMTTYNPGEGGWGWGTTIVSAVVGTALGALTAYKARRDKSRVV